MNFISAATYRAFVKEYEVYKEDSGNQRLGQYFCNHFNIDNDSILFYARYDNDARKTIESQYVNWQE